jgi:hypothetical protein
MPVTELGHRVSSPRMVKATLRKTDSEPERRLIGRALDRARELRGWNLNQFADAVKRDPRQVARWFDGSENPQFHAIYAVESLREWILVAFAEIAGEGVQVTTQITVTRRTA